MSQDGLDATTSPWRHAVSSQGAGALSTLLFYPLDVVKTRFMAQDGTEVRKHNGIRYHRVVPAMRTMVQQEGVGSLFRGSHVAVGASAVSWGAYMLVYRALEQSGHDLLRARQVPNDSPLFLLTSFASSASGNVAVAVGANPLWLVKHRMQLEEAALATNSQARMAPGVRHYASVTSGLRHAVRHDGFASLWRGVTAQLLVGIPSAATFPLYEWLKVSLGGGHASGATVAVCSVVAKSITTLMSHPLVLIKVRMQDAKRSADPLVKYESISATCRLVVRREGWRGFYRGLMPALMQVVPRSAMQIYLYESFMQLQCARPR